MYLTDSYHLVQGCCWQAGSGAMPFLQVCLKEEYGQQQLQTTCQGSTAPDACVVAIALLSFPFDSRR
jgi:hypothetical protein